MRDRVELEMCRTCGILMPQLMWSGAKIVSGALCAHRDTVRRVFVAEGERHSNG